MNFENSHPVDHFLLNSAGVYLIVAICLFLTTCGKSDIQNKTSFETKRVSESIKVDSATRKYILHIPKERSHNSSVPLVFVLHGGRGSPKGIEKITKFHNQETSTEFMTVYPAAKDRFWNDGRAVANSEVNDIRFINSLIDNLRTQYNIDKDAVFATGLSNGGTMSVRLACESPKIKAVSAVASTAVKSIIDTCDPKIPKSFMIIQGTDDPITDFNGVEKKKRKIVSHNYAIQKLVSLNKCSSNLTHKTIPDSSNDATSTFIKRYDDCKNDSKVVSVVVKNGGHTWPGGPQYRSRLLVGNTSKDFNASELIWEFFYSQI